MANLSNSLMKTDEMSKQINDADVAELVDARDLKSLDGNIVRVRVPPPAPPKIKYLRGAPADQPHTTETCVHTVSTPIASPAHALNGATR